MRSSNLRKYEVNVFSHNGRGGVTMDAMIKGEESLRFKVHPNKMNKTMHLSNEPNLDNSVTIPHP